MSLIHTTIGLTATKPLHKCQSKAPLTEGSVGLVGLTSPSNNFHINSGINSRSKIVEPLLRGPALPFTGIGTRFIFLNFPCQNGTVIHKLNRKYQRLRSGETNSNIIDSVAATFRMVMTGAQFTNSIATAIHIKSIRVQRPCITRKVIPTRFIVVMSTLYHPTPYSKPMRLVINTACQKTRFI